MFNFGRDLSIDLGTASVLIYMKGKGIILREPSVVAMDRDSRKVLAVGAAAQRMVGRTPGTIVAIRPLRDGVIADYEVTKTMLKYFLDRAVGTRWLARPRVSLCIPSGVTGVEKRAIRDAALEVGAREARLIEEPLAAALGAGLDITKPNGHMVVDIGGGTCDIAVISLGGIVRSNSLRVGGDRFDESLVKHLKRERNLLIGERTAEEIKVTIGTVFNSRELTMDVRGRDLIGGLPKTVRMTSAETQEALWEPVTAICQAIKTVLEQTPPELTADIHERGIVLTGGGSLLDGLDKLISHYTGVPAYLAEDPISCCVLGTAMALESYDSRETHLEILPRLM